MQTEKMRGGAQYRDCSSDVNLDGDRNDARMDMKPLLMIS